MTGDYVGYIASAYAVSVLVLGGLGVWTFIDARATERRLKAMEARRRPRRDAA